MNSFFTFALGILVGGIFCWNLIKRYKKEQGYNSDPLDGKP